MIICEKLCLNYRFY